MNRVRQGRMFRRGRSVLMAGLVGLLGCNDLINEPAILPAGLSFDLSRIAGLGAAQSDAALSKANTLFLRLTPEGGGTTITETIGFDFVDGEARIEVQLQQDGESARYQMELEVRRDADPLFRNSSAVSISTGQTNPIEPQLRPVIGSVQVSGSGTITAIGDVVEYAASSFFATGDELLGASVAWESSDESVLSSLGGGRFESLASGNATVRAIARIESDPQVEGTQAVSVSPEAASIFATSGSSSVSVGETVTLTATPFDRNGNRITAPVTWSVEEGEGRVLLGAGSTTDPVHGATVEVTGTARGSVRVRASSGAASSAVDFSVVAVPAQIEFDQSGLDLVSAGDEASLTATVRDAVGNALDDQVTWSVASGSDVVEIISVTGVAGQSGRVDNTVRIRALRRGSAILRATSGSVTSELTVTSQAVPVGVNFTPGTPGLLVGQTLVITGTPVDGLGNTLDDAISWSVSSGGSFVSLDPQGTQALNVLGVAPGTATLTVSVGGFVTTLDVVVADPILIRVEPSAVGTAPNIVATLAEAVALVANGGEVYLAPGTHTASEISVTKSMAIMGDPGTLPVLQGPGSGNILGIQHRPDDYLNVARVEFQNADVGLFGYGQFSGMVIVESVFRTATYGVDIFEDLTTEGNNSVAIRSSTFVGQSSRGIRVSRRENVEIDHNTLTEQGNIGIQLQDGSGDVFGNNISGCGGSCILVRRTSMATVSGNTISRTNPAVLAETGIDVDLDPGQQVTIRDNGISGPVPADLTQPGDFAFMRGINIQGGSPSVFNNDVTGAGRGLMARGPFGSADVRDNRFIGVQAGVSDQGGLTNFLFTENDVTNYFLAFEGTGAFPAGSLICNWWDNTNGPVNGDGSVSSAYTPWATAPIARDAGGQCDGMPRSEITGTVTIEGTPVSGITVTLNTGETLTTDSNGEYRFSGLTPFTNYTVTISGYPFDASFPATSQNAISPLGGAAIVNFAGVQIRTSVISGVVTINGSPMAGVTISLEAFGNTLATTTTDASGVYSFSNLAAGSYHVILSGLPAMYLFPSRNQVIVISINDTGTVNFVGSV